MHQQIAGSTRARSGWGLRQDLVRDLLAKNLIPPSIMHGAAKSHNIQKVQEMIFNYLLSTQAR